MERAVDALRARGEGFAMTLTTLAGRPIEADGHVIGGRAVLRLQDVSGVKRDLADLHARHQKLSEDSEALRTLVEALPSPGLGARRRRQARLRQCRLCPRGGSQGRRRTRSRRASSCSTAPPATSSTARTRRRSPMPGGCRRLSPAAAASST